MTGPWAHARVVLVVTMEGVLLIFMLSLHYLAVSLAVAFTCA
jgi:hypothetical protein